MTSPSAGLPDSFTVVAFRDGSVIYLDETRTAVMTTIKTSDTNRFIELETLDGEVHSFRVRDVVRVFRSTPEARHLADEMNYQRVLEKAQFQSEKMKERAEAMESELPPPTTGPGLVGPTGGPIEA